MIFSINFSISFRFVTLLMTLALVGCAGMRPLDTSGVASPDGLQATAVVAEGSAEKLVVGDHIRWTAVVSGGSGPLHYTFELEKNGKSMTQVQTGPEGTWTWRTQEPGDFRVRFAVADDCGERADSPWSPLLRVEPQLAVEKPVAGDGNPQVLSAAPLVWDVSARGGIAPLTYTYEIEGNGGESQFFIGGFSETLVWHPAHPGAFRVRVRVVDARGQGVVSGWSADSRIEPPLTAEPPRPDKPSPQAASSTEIAWAGRATGGVGVLEHTFEVEKDGEILPPEPAGSPPVLAWRPDRPGDYRVRLLAVDRLGNRAVSPWSEGFRVEPALEVLPPGADPSPPQAARARPILWRAEALGGVGALSLAYTLERDGEILGSFPADPAGEWSWLPGDSGSYRARATVVDTLGNRAEGPWSDPYRVEEALTVAAPAAAKASPQMALGEAIRWTVAAAGGVGKRCYSFELEKDGVLSLLDGTSEPEWSWSPPEAGLYRVRARVTDARGNVEVSPWSAFYRIEPPLSAEVPNPAKPSPQAARSSLIAWTGAATGGVGPLEHVFEMERDGELLPPLATGALPALAWQPDRAGDYRLRLLVVDRLGNRSVSPWSESFRVEPPLQVSQALAEPSSPQAVGKRSILWQAKAEGGVGELALSFSLERDGEAFGEFAAGATGDWSWLPGKGGDYRVRASAVDALGNRVDGPWSALYRVEPPLTASTPTTLKASPQMALGPPIRWTVPVSGGVGTRVHVFEVEKDGDLHRRIESAEPGWSWVPPEAGNYRVRCRVTDALGNEAESPWSPTYRIEPPLVVESPSPDWASPQAAQTRFIVWEGRGSGGVGPLSYRFEVERDGILEPVAEAGADPKWIWNPEREGSYRVRLLAADALGNGALSRWSQPFRIEPPLTLSQPRAEVPAPQMLGSIAIPWLVEGAGGVGEKSYEFFWRLLDGEPQPGQSGPEGRWLWTPAEAGPHQVRVRVTDSLGNVAVSSWSKPFGIAPPLRIESLGAGETSPQAAQTRMIPWRAAAIGGVGTKRYAFELSRNGQAAVGVQAGPEPTWSWHPEEEGDYRLRVTVSDALGNRVAGGWSEPFRVMPPLFVSLPGTEVSSPQVANTVTVPWTVTGSGGVGAAVYSFEVEESGGGVFSGPPGPDATWIWQPTAAGEYRVRATMTDVLGNRAISAWSEGFRIEPPLTITSFATGTSSPQAAQSVTIDWSVEARGGVGEKHYRFECARNGAATAAQSGPESLWSWYPEMEGDYRVRVVVGDALGNRAETPWSEVFEIAPPLSIAAPAAANPATQYLIGKVVDWSVAASGGVGRRSYRFELEGADGEIQGVLSSGSAVWRWLPTATGFYRLRVIVSDALGNQKSSDWSARKEVVLPLSLQSLTVYSGAPLPALSRTLRCAAATSGGIGEISFEFRSLKEGQEILEMAGPSPVWEWLPRKPGTYRIKVIARDREGNRVGSDWSAPCEILPAIDRKTLLAVLPVDNLSGVAAPCTEIGENLAGILENRGLRILPAGDLAAFMKRHRVRYTGGISSVLARALKEETGAGAILITSLESYQAASPPKIALSSRVVLSGESPEIAWMESAGLSGDDHLGLLGLSAIKDGAWLQEKALATLSNSLLDYLAGRPTDRPGSRRKYRPRESYRASEFDPARHYSVAVVPFLNKYARKNAGFVVPLHFVQTLNQYENVRVIEPGLVREHLLRYRLIMPGGPSLAVADVLKSQNSLDADLVLSGQVFDYQDQYGTPKVDVSTQVFDAPKRKVVWWSRGKATGNDGVLFFDAGRVLSAHSLMHSMAGAIDNLLFEDD